MCVLDDQSLALAKQRCLIWEIEFIMADTSWTCFALWEPHPCPLQVFTLAKTQNSRRCSTKLWGWFSVVLHPSRSSQLSSWLQASSGMHLQQPGNRSSGFRLVSKENFLGSVRWELIEMSDCSMDSWFLGKRNSSRWVWENGQAANGFCREPCLRFLSKSLFLLNLA